MGTNTQASPAERAHGATAAILGMGLCLNLGFLAAKSPESMFFGVVTLLASFLLGYDLGVVAVVLADLILLVAAVMISAVNGPTWTITAAHIILLVIMVGYKLLPAMFKPQS